MPVVPFNQVDPFTQCYQALRDIIMTDPVLAAAPFSMTSAKFQDLSDPKFFQLLNKASVQGADAPQVYMVQGKAQIKIFGTNSRISNFRQIYPLIAVHADQRVLNVNIFKWRLMVSLFKAGGDIGLTTLVQTVDISDGIDDLFGHQEFKQFQERWMTVTNIVVDGYIDRNDVEES